MQVRILSHALTQWMEVRILPRSRKGPGKLNGRATGHGVLVTVANTTDLQSVDLGSTPRYSTNTTGCSEME